MDPFTIATSVAKITATCLSTGKAIYDLSCRYQDAPRNMVAISSEAAVVSASLSQIQALILSKKNPEQLLRTRPEIAATLDTSLTGCMVLFSCLDEEIREISKHARGRGDFSWKGKARITWKQEAMQELLDGIRGQQLAINTLIQLLQMDSLAEITQLLQQKAPELKKTVEWTGSLRRSYPSVRVAESIFNQEDRMSVYSAADSMMSSSELEFDFDDIIVNSTAYRRALAAARHPTPATPPGGIDGDLIDFSDSDTLQQAHIRKAATDPSALSKDLLGLRFSTVMDESSLSPSIANKLQINEETGESSKVSFTSPSDPQTEIQSHGVERKPVAASSQNTQPPANVVNDDRNRRVTPQQEEIVSTDDLELPNSAIAELNLSPRNIQSPNLGSPKEIGTRPSLNICFTCGTRLEAEFVRALGHTYHLECFTCNDCGKIVASKFFPFPSEPPHQYAFCETDYFKRLDLICFSCGKALRSSYVTALGRKYHREHFTCRVCSTLLGAEEKYFEHEGETYCFYDYVTLLASICDGCSLPIVKQYLETARNGENQIWHPECYMIHKYWNVRMRGAVPIKKARGSWVDEEGRGLDAVKLQQRCDSAMDIIFRTWEMLSTFEEKAASIISEVLAALSSGQRPTATQKMAHLLSVVGTLFAALESVRERQLRIGLAGIPYSKEARLLCKKCVGVMMAIAEEPAQTVTQEHLSLITGLAHYLKLLIRMGIGGSMSHPDPFLEDVSASDVGRDLKFYRARLLSMADPQEDRCTSCNAPVEDACFKRGGGPVQLWHDKCIECSNCHRPGAFTGEASTGEATPAASCRFCGCSHEKDIHRVSQLKQNIRLLWVALARLMVTLELEPAILVDVQMEDTVTERTMLLNDIPSQVGDARMKTT